MVFNYNLGNVKVIDSKNLKLKPDVWFRCAIILDFNSMKFTIQQNNIREIKLVFVKQLTEHNRGTIGFGTNGII